MPNESPRSCGAVEAAAFGYPRSASYVKPTEAGQALGLPPWKVMRLIVLPQALRAVIPAMVGQFISLFKDTSLLVVVGVLELLAVSSIANNQAQFLGRGLVSVTLPFVAMIYWVGSYTMSRESRRLEKKLGVGER
ncbi:MAG: ABC transporter permease subunit [Acidimicrobiia bacterium]